MRRHTCLLATIAILAGAMLPRIAWAQAEPRSGHFTTSDGVTLHYLEAGAGSALVFVPGWTMPAWIWEHQIRRFAQDHRVIAFDPRGQGASDKPSFGYDHTRRARDIGELLAHLDTDVLVDWEMHYEDPTALAGRYWQYHPARAD